MDNKDLNIQNYSISDLFDILEVDNNDFMKAVEMCDEYIEHFDGQSNEVMSNFFLQIKDKLQEYVSDNNINVYNFDDIYETDVSNEDQQNIDVGNLYERLDEFDISGIGSGSVSGSGNDEDNTNDAIYASLSELENVDSLEETNTSTINNIGAEYNSNNNKNIYMIGYEDGNIIYDSSDNENPGFINTYDTSGGFDSLNSMVVATSTTNLVIDSQFRPINNEANDFTIDLSEPLVDVVSIELQYYQFVYSLYNIDADHNTNNFFITDLAGELYTINIDSGLYKTQQQLVEKINTTVVTFFTGSSIFNNNFPDLSGNLDTLIVFSYNELTGKTTVKIRNFFKKINFFDLNIMSGNGRLNYNLGYFLGFRKRFLNSQVSLGYYMVEQQGEGAIDTEVIVDSIDPNINVIVSTGIVDIRQPKFLILSIDDYNQNRQSQNLITASEGTDNTIHLRTINKCNETDINNLQIPSNPRNRPLALLYAHNERVIDTINNIRKIRSLNVPAAIPDIFAMIPVETGRNLGELINNSGLTTEMNIRKFFGPVNINRLRIRIYNEKGILINLNGSDYSFRVGVERLYNKNDRK